MNSDRSSKGYNGGRIIRICLKDFMTYTKLKLHPTAGLNMLIGPNGCGKSSIVSAICLGLAGKPAFTGRKINLNDYIKHGCRSAIIELKLHDPQNNKNIIIARKIRQNGTSEYTLNRKVVKESVIVKEVSRFNIQVNNMCQFLPQEKVADFSRMTPKQLLESMQQAVGDHEMYGNYKELIKLCSVAQNMENEIKNKKEFISKEKQQNEMLKGIVQVFEERQSQIDKIKRLELKLPFLKYQIACNRTDQQGAIKEKLAEEVRILEENHEPLEIDRLAIEKEVAELKKKISTLVNEVCKQNLHAENAAAAIKQMEAKVYETTQDLKSKLEGEQEQEKRMSNLEAQIAALTNEYKKSKEIRDAMIPKLQEVKKEKDKVIDQCSRIHSELCHLNSTQAELARKRNDIQKELQKLNDVGLKKMQHLCKLDHDTYEAMLWLNENRSVFKKHVYDPILTLIETPNRTYVKFIENHISFKDLIVFLCEDKEDATKFTKILREEKKLAVNTAPVPPKSLSSFQPIISVEELRTKYHFTNYLKDLFKAPDAVVSYLCEMYKIHLTPVGDESTEWHIQHGVKHPFSKCYTPHASYHAKKSQYGSQNTSLRISQIREKNILSPSENSEEKQRNLEEQFQVLEEKEASLSRTEKGLLQKNQEFTEKLERLRTYEKEYIAQEDLMKSQSFKVSEKKNLLEVLKSQKLDVNLAKQNAAVKIDNLHSAKMHKLSELHDILQDCLCNVKKKVKARFHLSLSMKKKNHFEKVYEECSTQLEKKKHDLNDAAQKFISMRKQAKQLYKSAESAFGMKLNVLENREKLVEKIGDLPDKLDDVESEIIKLKARVNCMSETDQAVIDEHEKRKCNIREAEKDLESSQKCLARMNDKIEEKKNEWIVPLEGLVAKVSSTFSRYFESLGCAGEISIKKSDKPDDFDNYGLSIQVKYWDNAPLRELSQAHHSGGECSVATIIFILSLQEQTEVPFRCVDEINQGMDSVNERRIFELVAQSAGKCSQYFLLTPKLLPGLAYSKEMKIHIIHNGPALEIDNWDLRQILRNRQESN